MKPSSEIKMIHHWLYRKYGKPQICENPKCTNTSKTEYCLIAGKKYARNRKNFRNLCKSCHRKYDYMSGLLENQRKACGRIGKMTGNKNGKVRCKFSIKDIKDIRKYCQRGHQQKYIAAYYKVDPSTISLICNNKTYREF